jgi:pectate lyase
MRVVTGRLLLRSLVCACCSCAVVACSSADDDSGDDAPIAGSGGGQAPGSGGSGGAGSGGRAASGSGGAGAGAGGSGGAGAGGSSGGSGGGGGAAMDAGSDAAADAGGADAGAPATSSEGLIGWAAERGDGVDTTTGGEGGDEVTVSTAQALLDAADSDGKKVIKIEGTIAAPVVRVRSDKTLIGVGDDATIEGGIAISGSSDEPVTNVIVKNLRVDGRTSGDDADNDAILIRRAHHVWIDHCEVFDGGDGNTDIVNGASWITVSWTRFHYTSQAPDPGHRFSNLLGNSADNADEDTGRIKVTLHHDWWDTGCVERMPRVRFGQVHVFDNYYSATGNNYAIAAGQDAQIRIENNYFDGVNDPHKFYDGETGGAIAQSGNVYMGASSGGAHDEGGDVFDPPYDYELDPGSDVKAIVMAGAGPR